MDISFNTLPPIGSKLDGGIFAGVITQKDGTHVAITLLPERATKVNWKDATTWAEQQGGVLPTRPVAALLFANVKAELPDRWHWTGEEEKFDDEEVASYAWSCGFYYGTQTSRHKSYEGSAVAVRLIPLSA